MTARTRLSAALLALLLVSARPAATGASAQQLPIVSLIERYTHGQYATAKALADVPDRAAAVQAFSGQAERWIDADRSAASRRRLAAATFALDVAQQWMGEEPWPYARLLLAWSCEQLRLSPTPEPAERLWHLTAVATMQGAGDWLLLAGRFSATGRAASGGGSRAERESGQGHLSHAIARFPSEARFSMAAVIAQDIRQWEVGGFGRDLNGRSGLLAGEIDADYINHLKAGDVLAADGSKWTGSTPAGLAKSQFARIIELRALGDRYASLAANSELSAEAHLRAGLVQFRLAERDQALAHLSEVFRATRDPYFTHLAYLFIGGIRESQGQQDDAIAAYRQALVVVPRAQSATSVLVARLAAAGRQAEAAAVVNAFFTGGRPPADPWQSYRLGDSRLTPTLMAQLRAEIK